MSGDSPASILFDELGNPVGVIQDGVVYRLQVESKRKAAVTATRTVVSASTTDVLLLASNTARLNCIVYNNSDSILYVGLGTTSVTASNFTFYVSSQSNFQIPSDFVGEIRGAWIMSNGSAIMTETQ